MIPLNIDDPVVLRRTLEELEGGIIKANTPITPIDKLPSDADLVTTVAKLNEVIVGYNSIAGLLNISSTTSLS